MAKGTTGTRFVSMKFFFTVWGVFDIRQIRYMLIFFPFL